MASLPTDESARGPSLLRQRVPLFKILGTADDAIYSLERLIVVASLIIMTQASFMKVLSDFLAKVTTGPVFYLIVVASLFLIARVSTAAAPSLKDQSGKATLYAGIITALGTGYLYLIQTQESAIAVALTAMAMGLSALWVNFNTQKQAGGWTVGLIASSIFTLVLTGIATKVALGFDTGLGYSWAPNISLTLLLWMAFLGASMATHDKRHLALDAVRKLIPEKHTRIYAALSMLASGIVTAGFFYLSWTYFGKRIAEVPEPGKIPDWIKVLSIPVALGTMTTRFFAYAIAEAVGSFLGVPPEPQPATLPIGAAATPAEEAKEVTA